MKVMDWLRRTLGGNGILPPSDDQSGDADERRQLRRELDEIEGIMREFMTERGLIQHREPEGRGHERD